MAEMRDIKARELRDLVSRLHAAVEEYAEGRASDTNEIARQLATFQHRAESPEVFAERLRYQPLDLCALMVAIEAGVLEILANKPDQTRTADELFSSCDRPREDIVRTLRLLTAIGVCDEVGYQSYRANEKTPVIASPGQIGGFRVSSVPVSGLLPKIEEFFRLSAEGKLDAATMSTYVYTYGKPMYEVLRETNRRGDFDAFMESRKKEKKRRWHQAYPVKVALAEELTGTVIDVGGSHGHDLLSFQEEMPEYRGRLVLQDLPETISGLSGQPKGFEAMAYDFFTPQPIEGARIYLLLAVLHNWNDEACIKILKNLALAMKPGYSRLLISAMLLPDAGAERRAAELDIQMWMLQLSRQRTESEMRSLLQSSGLILVKIWENGDRESIVEACVA